MFISACIIILAVLILIFVILSKLYITLFMITGLSKSVAKFQVFSLFTNSGFTSGETELVMYNKQRRKIAIATMVTGYIFGTLVAALVVGVVVGLNFKDSEYSTVYWDRILITFIITVGVFIAFLILTKIPVLRKWFYNLLKRIVSPEIVKRGNPIIYEELVYDRFIAQVELRVLRKAFKDTPIGKINFYDAGITFLLINTKDDYAISGKDMDNHVLEQGDIIHVFGTAEDIEKVFSMK